MHRVDINARDLRILDPLLSDPSTGAPSSAASAPSWGNFVVNYGRRCS